eukprot:TRINITY_DN26505_c0_g1_i1.p2 TRINITY_DN26505_c0_g1~~TRINITY_DN26505_c0_g1_i1.p2  ORF type:complete len:225 (-),score=56.65 TRINITY_DN26505_c0_g1_i1:355-1029(-)
MVLQRQEGINKANTRMNAINLAGKLMLVSRIDSMQLEMRERAEMALVLQQQVDSQQASILELEARVEALDEEGEEMRTQMEAERQRMEIQLHEHQQRLEQHQRELKASQERLGELQQLSVGQDLVVDSVIAAGSLWVSSLAVVEGPLKLLASLAMRRSSRGLTQALRILVALFLVRHFRQVAKNYNVHNKMGSFRLYGQWMYQYVVGKMSEPPADLKAEPVQPR